MLLLNLLLLLLLPCYPSSVAILAFAAVSSAFNSLTALTRIGIILEYLWKTTPFTGIIVLAVLQSIGEDYEDVARSLGASAWQRLRFVILPVIMPGALRASILIFSFTFGAFEIPYLLGQRFPSALPVLAFRNYHDVDLNARPEAMAMSMVIAAIISLLILLYMWLTETYVRQD